MRIIPAIDIIDGSCVRLTKGDYTQKKVYNNDPVAVARQFEEAGLKYLHLVDLDGAKTGAIVNWNIVDRIVNETGLIVDFGGGIKREEDIQKLIDLGVKQVNLGSIAVKDPDLVSSWIDKFGADTIIISADVKEYKIAITGWMEKTTTSLSDFVGDYVKRGARYITCTDIGVDGTLEGPNRVLYENLLEEYPEIRLIASGGVSTVDDLKLLAETRVDGVIVGKAIYEGRITIGELATLTN